LARGKSKAVLLKTKDIEVFLAIIFYLLAIAEEFLKLGIFSFIYSTVSQTTVFGLLLIIATGFIVVYLVQSMTKSSAVAYVSRIPPNTGLEHAYTGNDYGVKWHLFEPHLLDRQPWADGPFCPKCDRELEVVTKGHISKHEIWKCPMCDGEYPKPKGDVKDMVEKNFAAYLRKKGLL
jgi:ribosomal protein L37AE/L43A